MSLGAVKTGRTCAVNRNEQNKSGAVGFLAVEAMQQTEQGAVANDLTGEINGFGAFTKRPVVPAVGHDVGMHDQDVGAFSEL